MTVSQPAATPTSGRTPAHPERPAGPPVTLVDWLMLLLAVVSVALLTWVTFWDVSDTWTRRVVTADIVVCAVFAIEFVWRWRRSGLGWRFLRRYWYEVVGMVPLAHPAFRSFRLLRIVVVLARLGRAADRAFGERATAYVLSHSTDAIVDAIRTPITVAVLDEVIAVIRTGHYTRHIAAAINENRAELDALILDLIKQDRTAGRLRYVPFHDDIVRLVADTVFRIAHEALDDPRVQELISDAIRESATELRANVEAGLRR